MNDIALARPSSTVVLVRESEGDPELFMVLRHAKSSFGASYAFPGGVVDPEDSDVHDYCRGVSARTADKNIGIKENGLDYYSAAVRELFEESGVLLADTDDISEGLPAARDALNDGSDNWADFVKRNKLKLRCEQLRYISHWITPPSRSKRYSTRFFLAAIPEGQAAMHCGGELTGSRWISAQDALDAGRAGDIVLPFPTIKTLEVIARHKTLGDLVDWASSCVDWGITSMMPMIIQRNGQSEIVLPGDADYPGVD